jgi:hypothetical protein
MSDGRGLPAAPRPVPQGPRRGTTLAFIALAAPIALAVELAVRALVPIPGMAEIRADLGAPATTLAWAMLLACLPAGLLGQRVRRSLVRRGLARRPDASPAARATIELEALLLATTVPQVPALLAIVAAMFGAELRPVLLTVALSTFAVMAQGLGARARSEAEASGAGSVPASTSRSTATATATPESVPVDPASMDDVVVMPIEDSIDLHTFQPRDVKSVVEEYLHEARARGFREVRVVHGRGKGVQRAIVQSLLARHPAVESFGDAPASRGGWGATLVWLKPR